MTKLAILSNLKIHDQARVVGYQSGEKIYRHKLLSMGLTPGTIFTVTRIAPLGDPIEITVRDYCLSIRKQEARCLQVEKLSE